MLSDCSRVRPFFRMYQRGWYLDRFTYSMMVGTFLKICREIPNRALGKKYLQLYMRTWAHVIALGDIKLLQNRILRLNCISFLE